MASYAIVHSGYCQDRIVFSRARAWYRFASGIVVLTTVLISLGCMTRQKLATNWRLRSTAKEPILVPPSPRQGEAVVLREARSTKRTGLSCNVSSPEIQLSWRGRTALVRVDPGLVDTVGKVAVTGGPVTLEGEPLRDLDWWPRFRKELDEIEIAGCLARSDAERLSLRVLENITAPSSLVYQLRFSYFPGVGYLDLGPEFSLKLIAPLLKPGVKRFGGSADVAGWETVNYDLKPDRGGVRLSLRSAEQVRGGTTARVRRPATVAITLPDSARFLRFFFRMWQVSGDRRIALLAVSRKELLKPLTQQFEADPERMCGSLGPQNGGCIALPKEMALNPELKVLANGQTVYVPISGTLGGVLRSAGRAAVQRSVASPDRAPPLGREIGAGRVRPFSDGYPQPGFDRRRGYPLVEIPGKERNLLTRACLHANFFT